MIEEISRLVMPNICVKQVDNLCTSHGKWSFRLKRNIFRSPVSAALFTSALSVVTNWTDMSNLELARFKLFKLLSRASCAVKISVALHCWRACNQVGTKPAKHTSSSLRTSCKMTLMRNWDCSTLVMTCCPPPRNDEVGAAFHHRIFVLQTRHLCTIHLK